MLKKIDALSYVSIIVPCRNEERFISACLESIIDNSYPKDKLEVLIVDGKSEDKTREIVKNYTDRYPFIKLLENPKKITPAALNIGIKNSRGEIVIKMDAHSLYERDYILKCVSSLQEWEKEGARNVGGVLKTIPSKNTLAAKAITIVLSHPFGAGSSYFRTGTKEPREVDTVFGGCYKREVFDKIGLFDERLIRGQDIEFNKRLKKDGGKILLVPEITAYYYPQSNFFGFLKHNFSDGIWTTFPLKFGVKIFSFRHLVPLMFVFSLIILALLSFFFSAFFKLFLLILVFYFSASFYFSFKISLREGDLRYLFLMPIIFSSRHFSYGLGSIFGLTKLII